jgi:DNA-binding XRE family transcriptional regulator
MNDDLYLKVLKNNPDINKDDVKTYLAINDYDLLITYKNNQRELFDTYDNTRRYVPYISEALTTEQMRKEFTIQLSKLMRRKNITQEELAYKIGTSQSMVSKYLKGEALPGFIILKKIADALHSHVDDLYSVY